MDIIERTFSPLFILLNIVSYFTMSRILIISLIFVALYFLFLYNDWFQLFIVKIFYLIRSYIIKLLDTTYGIKRFIFIAIIDIRMVLVISDMYGNDSEHFGYAAAWLAMITSVTAIIANVFPYKKFKLVSYAGLEDDKLVIKIVNIGSGSALLTNLAISFKPHHVGIKNVCKDEQKFDINHRYRMDLGIIQNVVQPDCLVQFEVSKELSSIVFDTDEDGAIRDNFFENLEVERLTSSADVENMMRKIDSEIWISIYGRKHVVKNKV